MKEDLFEGRMTDPAAIRRFIFAGRALFTIQNKRTGTRFTYKVSNSKPREGRTDAPILFVKVLQGPCNETAYGYLGHMNSHNKSRLNAGRKGRPDAVSFKGLNWLLHNLDRGVLHDTVEFYHSGKCGACGRTLTVPESIETGLGPVCARKH